MSEAKQKCQLNNCNRAVSTFCYCCKKSICTRHFNEHIDAVRAQVDPLADTVNTMVEKIRDLTIEQVTEMPIAKLNQWKCDMHRLVDEVFSSKSKEIEDLIEKNKGKFHEHKTQQWENLMKIQDEVKQLIEDGDATFQQIESLKNQLAKIEERQTGFRNNFLFIRTQLFGNDLVTLSSNLIRSDILLPLFQYSTPINPNPDAPTYQPAGLNTPFAGAGPTARRSGGFGFTPTERIPENNPFSIPEGSPNTRPVVKAKRWTKP